MTYIHSALILTVLLPINRSNFPSVKELMVQLLITQSLTLTPALEKYVTLL